MSRSATRRARTATAAVAAPEGVRRERKWLKLAGILVAGLSLQDSSLRYPFFADDYLFLDQVRQRTLLATLRSPDPIGNFVRPIGRQVHFWWLSHCSGESPVAFHVANLVLFLVAIALLFMLARRLVGGQGAAIAASFVALHYAADVPLRWASGSQDLLALVGAVGAILLFARGWRWPASVALLAALLSKETVLFTPVIAGLAARHAGESWRTTVLRTWPLVLAVGAWGALVALRGGQHGITAAAHPSPWVVPAALIHLAQVSIGFEWGSGSGIRFLRVLPPWVPIALVTIALLWPFGSKVASPTPVRRTGKAGVGTVRRSSSPSGEEPGHDSSRKALWLGLIWALLGALPVAAVVSIWSAYYFLFALCGVGLALGALAASWPRWLTVLTVAVLAWGSESGRRLEEFTTGSGPWVSLSHINLFYLDRATTLADRLLASVKTARPTVPHQSTFFFTGLPAFAAFQTADGPLVRWAYRDSSLRSYYLSMISLDKIRRGPMFVFEVRNGTLQESAPDSRLFKAIAYTMMLNEHMESAHDVLVVSLERDSTDQAARHWLGWVQWGRGQRDEAVRLIAQTGFATNAGASPEAAMALERMAARDTLGAINIALNGVRAHALNPRTHAVLADLMLSQPLLRDQAGIEAFAARVLAPQDPAAWRRWAMVQVQHQRYEQAVKSLERYFALAGAAGNGDFDAARLLVALRRVGPGGDLAQEALRHTTSLLH